MYQHHTKKPKYLWPVMLSGIAAISFAAVLIKSCQASPLAIALYRLGISTLILLPVFVAKKGFKDLLPSHILWASLSGLFLSLHFILWIYSLNYTSVASSVVFVTTNPLFVSLLGWLLFREKPGVRIFFAIILVLLGGGLIAGRSALSGSANFGNLLALGGAVMASCYLLVGRYLRTRIGVLPYITLCYGTTSIILLAASLTFGIRLWGFDGRTWMFFLLLALGPQLIGHSSFNWGLKYFSTPKIAMLIITEPVGSALLAWAILKQMPTLFEMLGGFLILAGVYMTVSEKPVKATPL
jgi:drug/metabolite transporter (DMT)-like permease